MKMLHTMLRVRDLEKSLEFYLRVHGSARNPPHAHRR